MNDKLNGDLVAIATLLHDIGKYILRVKSCNKENFGYSIFMKGNHEELSQIYINHYLPSGLASFVNTLCSKKSENESLSFMLLGDRISSQERELYDNDYKDTSALSKPLINIFSRLYGYKGDHTYIQNDKLNLLNISNNTINDNSNFHFSLKEFDNFLSESIKIKSEFENSFLDIETKQTQFNNLKDLKKYLVKLISLLESNLYSVPASAYVDSPDIDLFHHSKLAAAISTVFFNSVEEGEITLEEIKSLEKDQLSFYFNEISKRSEDLKDSYEKISMNSLLKKNYFLKATFDFSGIQDFIFTITSKKALKTLKSRSFFISYLSNLYSNYIVNELNLTPCNVILNTGGKFEILLPNTSELKTKVIDMVNILNSELFSLFETKLYLSLGFQELNSVDFSIYKPQEDSFIDNSKFGQLPKSQKFKHLIQKEDNFFLPENKKLECKVCHVTSNEDNFKYEDFKCKTCLNFEKMYSVFKDNYLSIKDFQVINSFTKLNLSKYVTSYFGEIDLKINSTKSEDKYYKPYTIMGLGVLDAKEDSFEKISNEDLGNNSNFRTGSSYIAGLKLDVNSLGKIFKNGFGNENLKTSSFSRYSILSSKLKYFFEGHISELQKKTHITDLFNNNELIFAKEIDIIYSGGDDCFLIGSFDTMLNFYSLFLKNFKQYVKNDTISFSSSLQFYKSSYPVTLIASDLEDKLTYTKEHTNREGGIYFLQTVFKDDELNEMYDLAHIIYEITTTRKNRGLFKRLEEIESYIQKLNEDIKVKNGLVPTPAIWRLKYYIVREFLKKGESMKTIELAKEGEDLYLLKKLLQKLDTIIDSSIYKIQKGEFGAEDANLKQVSVASRLVELYTKNLWSDN